MSEKTPFIVLTVVFVVGLVGFVMMMTDANTGAVSIYEATNAAASQEGGNPQQFWRTAQGQRALYGGYVVQGETQAQIIQETGAPTTGQAYLPSGQSTGNLGASGTVTQDTTKRSNFRSINYNERGCKVFGVTRRLGQVGLQYAAETETLKDSIRMLECYKSGEQTAAGEIPMVRPAIANKPLIWGADATYCCFSTGLKATY